MVTKKKKSLVVQPQPPLTLPQLRVVIAKDVIAQLKKKAILAETGNYIRMSNGLDNMFENEGRLPEGFQIKGCHACAIGSVFISVFNKNDALTKDQLREAVDDPHRMIGYLKKPENGGFSENQLRLMEVAFEGKVIVGCDDEGEALEFNEKHFDQYRDNDEKILIAIMRNVIKNEGTFVP